MPNWSLFVYCSVLVLQALPHQRTETRGGFLLQFNSCIASTCKNYGNKAEMETYTKTTIHVVQKDGRKEKHKEYSSSVAYIVSTMKMNIVFIIS